MISRLKFKLFSVCFLLFILSGCVDKPFSPDDFDGDYGFLPKAEINRAEVELGRSLFFDKILSGNKNISCATCHHPSISSADGVSLSLGEGASGLGKQRIDGYGKSSVLDFTPRNAPALFNLGSSHFTTFFHDGRLEINKRFPNGIKSPAGENLPTGLNSPLAAQAMFPITSTVEMAGAWYENEIGNYAESQKLTQLWEEVATRVQEIPAYASNFQSVYGLEIEDIKYVDIANAMAAFIDVEFRSINSPFDRYINGDMLALSDAQKSGMSLFYGKAECSSCHSGVFQTDNDFHSIALPQVGPGKKDPRFVSKQLLSDFGRELVTDNLTDRYKFRTPNLRNIELTAPYGHNGAYKDLASIVRHHLSLSEMLNSYDCEKELLLGQRKIDEKDNETCQLMNDPTERALLIDSSNLPSIDLSDTEFEQVLSFLKALTDDDLRTRKNRVPQTVLSGLKVED